jgi:S-DNA-T family DNA segregation ATPase FtsK/SpoIIIE
LLVLSLATFDSRDPWLNHVVSGVTHVHNRAGLFGAYVSGLLLDVFGLAAWVIPAFFCLAGTRHILNSPSWDWWRWAGFLLLAFCLASAGTAWDLDALAAANSAASGRDVTANHGGGLLGRFLYVGLEGWLGATGALLLWIFVLTLGIQMLVGFSWLILAVSGAKTLWSLLVLSYSAARRPSQEAPARARTEEKGGAIPPGKAEDGVFFPADDGVPPLPPTAPYSPLPPAPSPKAPPPSSGQEADIPPWVRDFEEGCSNGLSPTATVDKYAPPSPLQDAAPETADSPAVTGPVPSGVSGMSHAPEGAGPLKGNAFPVLEAGRVDQADLPAAPGLIRRAVDLVRNPPRPPLPGVDLLGPVPVNNTATPRSTLEAKGRTLMACLADFGILGELVGITPGPVVTMFEIRPAPGVRVARIAGLSDDLALALKAVAVRIQAPVPGTDTVGIEIPNKIRDTVYLRELIGSRVFQEARSLLTVALGKDIAGGPAVADLSAMPHLLIAGATGAGKSVCINTIILSFLYKARPDEVKLLLIDPKRVEMAIYADLPHLVHPAVTEMPMAKSALDWAVREMESRYEDMAKAGVRNIADYNAKLASFGHMPPEELKGLAPFPYLVIIIDELADLMLVGTKEVETSVVRLAQLARAAGIHLILATQRPSVDVVTGLIKANFPCRVSFQVTSKHDSRTILDTVGAEYLLGKGDMLFKPGGGKFQRMHGAFVSDGAVQAVVDYWRSRQQPEYQVDFAEGVASAEGGDTGGREGFGDDIAADPMYQEVIAFICQQDKASIGLVQRRFRIGFNKAARFMEQMEKDGVVGPFDGSKPRQVYRIPGETRKTS